VTGNRSTRSEVWAAIGVVDVQVETNLDVGVSLILCASGGVETGLVNNVALFAQQAFVVVVNLVILGRIASGDVDLANQDTCEHGSS
jgi:hypothetical protein